MKSQIHEYQKNNFKIVSKKLIIAALLVVSISSFAQEQGNADKKANKPKKEKMSPEQRNQALLDKMTTELSLNAQQQEQVKPIIAEQSAKMETMRAERMNGGGKEMSKEEREAFKTKRQEDKKVVDAKFKAILTPDQFKKMKANEDAAREKMRESRGNRENGNGGDFNGGGNNDMN
jgi:periplasmic protein CpxP/Spy